MVHQMPHEFAVTSVPGPGPGPVRARTSGRGCGIITHAPELDDQVRALSVLRDGPARRTAVLAP